MSAGCVSTLKKVGVNLGSGDYGDVSSNFTRGLLVSAFSSNIEQSVEKVSAISGKFGAPRVSKGGLNYNPSLTFPLDLGDNESAGIGDFLACIFGAEVGVAVSSNFLHTFSPENSCTAPWLNLWSDKDIKSKQVTGFKPNSIKITLNSGEGSIQCEVSGIAKSESDLIADQTLVFSTVEMLTPDMTTLLQLGGASATNIDNVEITLTNEIEGFRPLGVSRDISKAFKKNIGIEISVSGLAFEDEIERDKWKNVTDTSFALTITDPDTNYLAITLAEAHWNSNEGADINEEDLLKMSGTIFATGDESGWIVALKNKYSKSYVDGSAIS